MSTPGLVLINWFVSGYKLFSYVRHAKYGLREPGQSYENQQIPCSYTDTRQIGDQLRTPHTAPDGAVLIISQDTAAQTHGPVQTRGTLVHWGPHQPGEHQSKILTRTALVYDAGTLHAPIAQGCLP